MGLALQLAGYMLSERENSRLRRAASDLNEQVRTAHLSAHVTLGLEGSGVLSAGGPARDLTTDERVAMLEKRVDALQTKVRGLPEAIKRDVKKDLEFAMDYARGELRGLKQAVGKYASEAKTQSRLWWVSVVLAVSGSMLEIAAAALTWDR